MSYVVGNLDLISHINMTYINHPLSITYVSLSLPLLLLIHVIQITILITLIIPLPWTRISLLLILLIHITPFFNLTITLPWTTLRLLIIHILYITPLFNFTISFPLTITLTFSSFSSHWNPLLELTPHVNHLPLLTMLRPTWLNLYGMLLFTLPHTPLSQV